MEPQPMKTQPRFASSAVWGGEPGGEVFPLLASSPQGFLITGVLVLRVAHSAPRLT